MEGVMSTEADQAEQTRDAEATPAANLAGTARRRFGRNPLVIAGAALAVVAVACAVVFGLLWHSAASGDSANVARMRDQALQAAEQGSVNLTTLDYRHVQQGLDRWKASTTGQLHTQLTAPGLVQSFTKQEQQRKAVSTSKVKDGVITELDAKAGKASALVIVDVTVTQAGGKPSEKLEPLEWNLTLTKAGWKLSGIPGGQANPTPGQ
jgi:Mce-associated membrane protein